MVFKQAYDPQTGYDIPYFRPTMEESVRGQGLPSPQEVNLICLLLLDGIILACLSLCALV
jgi:hypothetical protein